MNDCVRRFLFENLDIRGAIVRLDDTWQRLQVGREYPAPVAQTLGETAAVTALIAAQLKQPVRLTLQLRGHGPIRLLVMDCDEQLRLRGMAQAAAAVPSLPVTELLGAASGGQLLLSLELPGTRQPYQSIVPLEGDSIAAIFEHYLEQSEQQPSRILLAASSDRVVCLFLQKLPDAERRDPDAWRRRSGLAATVTPAELLDLPPEDLLRRLFHEDLDAGGLRLYDPRPIHHHCPEDWDKIRDIVRSLGREEAEALVRERGEIVIRDDICNRDYRFSPADVETLVGASASPTLH